MQGEGNCAKALEWSGNELERSGTRTRTEATQVQRLDTSAGHTVQLECDWVQLSEVLQRDGRIVPDSLVNSRTTPGTDRTVGSENMGQSSSYQIFTCTGVDRILSSTYEA
jgi:hypothetical protein